jgi:hypothetical protein
MQEMTTMNKIIAAMLLMSAVGCKQAEPPKIYRMASIERGNLIIDTECLHGSRLVFSQTGPVVDSALNASCEYGAGTTAMRFATPMEMINGYESSTGDCTTTGDNSVCSTGNNNSVVIGGRP